MLVNPPTKYRKRQVKEKAEPVLPTPPVPAPNLLTALYYYDVPCLVLTFDREIDISDIVVDQFTVNDNTVYSYTLQGDGEAQLLEPMIVSIPLVVTGPNTVSGLLTTATSTNGIKSSPNGENWAGVSEFTTEWAT